MWLDSLFIRLHRLPQNTPSETPTLLFSYGNAWLTNVTMQADVGSSVALKASYSAHIHAQGTRLLFHLFFWLHKRSCMAFSSILVSQRHNGFVFNSSTAAKTCSAACSSILVYLATISEDELAWSPVLTHCQSQA